MSSSNLPPKKKAKTAPAMQTNMFHYFKQPESKKKEPPTQKAETVLPKDQASVSEGVTTNDAQAAAVPPDPSSDPGSSTIPPPMVPQQMPPPRNAVWQSLHNDMVIVRKPMKEAPRSKVAAIDLDGTLVCWSASFSGFWPNQLSHYELWSTKIPNKLRALYDDGYKLLIVTNQGGVQRAHNGKKATLVKSVIDWVAHKVDRPVYAVMSTRSFKKNPDDSFHKPGPKMWNVAVDVLNKGESFNITESFFVGDSADVNDSQGGVDRRFAENVGKEHGGSLQFHTPPEYFGPSDQERRQKKETMEASFELPPPTKALRARAALLGGYTKGPVLLILCGVQGSGKSTFCDTLLESANIVETRWIHLSQDTINNGKPGKREKVEAAAAAALENGHSVVVDRMHLDPMQRSHFIRIATEANVAAHVVLLNPSRDIIAQRVRDRKNHPGKVQGVEGAKLALQSLDRLVLPSYKEDVTLINCAVSNEAVLRLAEQYRRVGSDSSQGEPVLQHTLSDGVILQSVTLGTMGMGKKKTKQIVVDAITTGMRAVDTAPTYKNEQEVGSALSEAGPEVSCIAKIPKSVTSSDEVHSALRSTLDKLGLSTVDLLLLHWPCDVMRSDTLHSVWKEMEACKKSGFCKALGVCNFNMNALGTLLSQTTIPPAVNQVERHPLLSQMDLLDFCSRNNVVLQAHSPLGQGKDTLLQNKHVLKVAEETQMSPSQVVIRWNLQQGVATVPKCSTVEHAQELLETGPLSPDHMKLLDSLENGHRFVAPPFMFGTAAFCWDTRPKR